MRLPDKSSTALNEYLFWHCQGVADSTLSCHSWGCGKVCGVGWLHIVKCWNFIQIRWTKHMAEYQLVQWASGLWGFWGLVHFHILSYRIRGCLMRLSSCLISLVTELFTEIRERIDSVSCLWTADWFFELLPSVWNCLSAWQFSPSVSECAACCGKLCETWL